MVIGQDQQLLQVLDNYSQNGGTQDSQTPNSRSSWCICGHCVEDGRMRDCERKCCRERRCISQQERCQLIVTDNDVIRTAANAHSDVTARRPSHDNRNLRHTAYRQYVMWQHGHLGKNNRVVIPCCVVWMIRRKWPSPDGKYTGFLEPK
jgi:hypothetical protein